MGAAGRVYCNTNFLRRCVPITARAESARRSLCQVARALPPATLVRRQHHVEAACRCINFSRPRSHDDHSSPVSLPSATVKASARSFSAFATLWILVGLGSAWRFRVCFGLCGHYFMSLTGVETI